jgi:hypothetical protein
MKEFNLEAAINGEPIQQRSGRPARLLAHDVKGDYPIAVLVMIGDEGERVYTYAATGRFDNRKPTEFDLVMAPKIVTKWLNIYKGCHGTHYVRNLFSTEEAARAAFMPTIDDDRYIATTSITFEEK